MSKLSKGIYVDDEEYETKNARAFCGSWYRCFYKSVISQWEDDRYQNDLYSWRSLSVGCLYGPISGAPGNFEISRESGWVNL